ncbi:MAG: hypothetical protein WDM86_14025 [Rhizomicrobium sp.]
MARLSRKLLVAAVAVLVGLPLPASAAKKCKSSAVTIGSISDQQVDIAWTNRVKHLYGSAWSNLNQARARQYSGQSQGLITLVFLTAYPCKRI